MAEDKKPDTGRKPVNESVDFSEAALTRQINNSNTTTVSQRVPITPAPPRPPERDEK